VGGAEAGRWEAAGRSLFRAAVVAAGAAVRARSAAGVAVARSEAAVEAGRTAGAAVVVVVEYFPWRKGRL
jgi:hypothetical protein